MTQEEKLEEAKRLYKTANADQKYVLERLFPELKESEDERIRQLLLRFVEYDMPDNYSDDFSKEDCLAWLEKQGGQSKEATYTHEVETGNGNIKALVTKKVHLPNFKIGDTIVEKDFDECGYGTIKDIKDGQYIFTDGSGININEQGCWQLVKSSTNIEQKPADKPKFKVGDVMRTLQEASDGIKDGLPVVVSIDDECYRCNNEIIPIADQENYEYPPKNRRQKPADNVEPKFNVGDKIISTISNIPYYVTEVRNGYYLTDVGCVIMFNAQDNFELSNQNLAWSEEDEKMYRGLHDLIYSTPYCDSRKEFSDWLESLKDRHTWKPTEEQMKILNEVLHFAANHESPYWNDYIFGTLNNLIRQLKKLREE